LGSLVGAVAAVLVAAIFRGASTAQEAQAAMGTPLEQKEAIIPTST
jgi:Helix-turn-helix domain